MQKLVITVFFLFGAVSSFSQSRDSLILGSWQLYPNVNVGDTLTFVRPETIGFPTARLNPNTRMSFGTKAVHTSSTTVGTPTKDGLIGTEFNLVSSGGNGSYLWHFSDDGKTLMFTDHNDTLVAVLKYELVGLNANSLSLKEK